MRQPKKIEPHRHLFGTMLDADIAAAIGVTPAAVCIYRRKNPDLPRFTCEDRRARRLAKLLRDGPMHIVDICKALGWSTLATTRNLKAMGAVKVRRAVWALPNG